MGRNQVDSGRKTKSVLGKDVFRCQERNSGRDWGTVAGNISFRSMGKSFVTRARVQYVPHCTFSYF